MLPFITPDRDIRYYFLDYDDDHISSHNINLSFYFEDEDFNFTYKLFLEYYGVTTNIFNNYLQISPSNLTIKHRRYAPTVFKGKPTYVYLPLETFTSACAYIDNNIMNKDQKTSATIFHTSFKDKFITEYHNQVTENNLTSIADSSSRLISKETYDYLYNLCEVKYKINILSTTSEGFEGFVGKHSYICCTYDKKEKECYLTSFFSYDPTISDILTNIELVKRPAKVSWVTGVCQDGSLDIETLPIEKPETIFESFYPWLGGVTVEDFINNFYESDESILLLYGDPGTGKSNLLKHLLHRFNESALITYQDDIRDLDKMFSGFLKNDDRFLIIEDADEFLTRRDQGNTSMKRLLNIADGLTSNKNKKVIFTTNHTNLNNVDQALLRPGRCFAAVKFERLNKEQSLAVARDLEIEPESLTENTYTLAELFAIRNNKLKLLKSDSRPTFGFSVQ